MVVESSKKAQLGIDLGPTGVTANDNPDSDTGSNGLQNYPAINSAAGNQVFGSFNSTPNTTFRLEFFSNAARDASGFGEGQTFLGTINVTTDGTGSALFTFSATSGFVGLYVSVTATPTGGGTSEFSNAVLALPVPIPVPTPTPQQVPNPITTATPPVQPTLIPQLVPTPNGTPLLVPLLVPSAIPQAVPQLVPNPVINTPITAPGVTPTFTAGQFSPTAGVEILQPKAALVVGAGLEGQSIVVVYNADGTIRGYLTEFPGFLGGVRVSAADVNNDGHPDILAAAGIGGAPQVKVFSGVDGSELMSFDAYDQSFTGGVYVTGGDLNGDGFAEIITGAGVGGGPNVKVFDGSTGVEISSFFAFAPNFTGGVSVGAGDLNNDGLAEIIVGAGPGGSPHVKVIEGTSLRQLDVDGTIAATAVLASYFAFDQTFTGGVFVATGSDLNGDGLLDVVTGAGPGGGPHVKLVDTSRMTTTTSTGKIDDSALISSFFGFEESFTGGVRVGEADALQDGVNEIVLGAGPGSTPRVRVLRANGLAAAEDFFAFVPEFAGGIFVD